MPRACLLLVSVLLLSLPGLAHGGDEEVVTAADTTERGRSLDRILDMVLLPDGRPIEEERSLGVLIDATPSLQGAELPQAMKNALERLADRLGPTRVGVTRVGAVERIAWATAAQPAPFVEALEAITAAPTSAYQNVYADLRDVAGQLKRRSGRRDLLLVTLENGDLEDDVEGTVKALAQADVRLFVVARQAFLSDTYGLVMRSNAPPRLDVGGPESAFVELPWGWLLQQGRANEGVGSGFPVYGLSRVAGGSGGRVFLWSPPSRSPHQCQPYGLCPFCTNDHLPAGEAYRSHRLQALAPLVTSRRDAMRTLAKDPLTRAVLEAWARLSKEGLVLGRPSLERAGGGLTPGKNDLGRLAPLGGSASFPSQARRAERLLADVDAIRDDLEKAIREAGEDQGTERSRATARTTAVLLHLLRVNLRLYVAFCEDVGPALAGREGRAVELPEIPFYTGSERVIGIGWSNLSLCHGVRPYLEVYLPGGAAVHADLLALADVVEPFLARYANTPYAALVRRSGLARFHLTVRGKYVPPPKRPVPGSTTEETTTTPERPARGGPSTGGTSGPTTGGD